MVDPSLHLPNREKYSHTTIRLTLYVNYSRDVGLRLVKINMFELLEVKLDLMNYGSGDELVQLVSLIHGRKHHHANRRLVFLFLSVQ